MRILRIIRQAVVDWLDDHAPSHAAAIAFYTIFSCMPLLMLAMGVASYFFGQDQAGHELKRELRFYIGREAGEPLAQIVLTTAQQGQTPWAVIVGAVTLLLGATAVFGQVQTALNEIWEAPSAGSFGRQVLYFFRRKLLAFAMVLVFGTMFLVLMVLTSAGPSLRGMFPESAMPRAVGFYVAYRSTLSLVLVSLLLAMAYKILPDAHIRWSDVWVGSLATSGAMLVGELLIGVYLRHAHLGSAFGAAGSLAVLLVWVYYSAMVFLLGAECTHVWAQQRTPKANV